MFFYSFLCFSCVFTIIYCSLFVVTVVTGVLSSQNAFSPGLSVAFGSQNASAQEEKKKLQILSHVSFRAFLDPLDCLHLFGFSVGFMFYIFLGLATWNHNSAQLRIKSYPNQNSLRVSANSGNPKHVTMFSSVIQDQHRNIDQRHSALVNIGNGTVGTGRSGSS